MYLEYTDYQNMGGTLDETAFNDFEYEAEMLVNWYTFNRLKKEETYPTELARCMYKLIQLAELEANALMLGSQTKTITDTSGNTVVVTTTASIASQSNDGVSISYNTINAQSLFDKLNNGKGNIIETTIQKYLQGVMNSLGQKLLYRGYYPGE